MNNPLTHLLKLSKVESDGFLCVYFLLPKADISLADQKQLDFGQCCHTTHHPLFLLKFCQSSVTLSDLRVEDGWINDCYWHFSPFPCHVSQNKKRSAMQIQTIMIDWIRMLFREYICAWMWICLEENPRIRLVAPWITELLRYLVNCLLRKMFRWAGQVACHFSVLSMNIYRCV